MMPPAYRSVEMIVFAPFVIQTEKFNRDSIRHCGDLSAKNSWVLLTHIGCDFSQFGFNIIGDLINRILRNGTNEIIE